MTNQELGHLLVRARQFVEEKLDPISNMVDQEDEIPREIIGKMARLGLIGLAVPLSCGGLGLSVLEICKVAEILGRTNLCFFRMLGWGVVDHLLGSSENQKEKYLFPLISGNKLSAYALTESHAGSDSSAIKCMARQEKGCFVLNGQKTMVSRGNAADVFILFAVTDPNKGVNGKITAFIVERGFKGFFQGKVQKKMGLRGMGMCEIFLEDCLVPEENVLGKVGQGFAIAMQGLNIARLKVIGAPAVGQAQKLIEISLDFAKKREQFGEPIIHKQAIQFMLADMVVDVYAARSMLLDAARKVDDGVKITREAAMVKLFASEMACRVADSAFQIHGGRGGLKNHFVEIAFRDARLGRIWDGTSEIQRLIISRSLMKEQY